MNNNVPNQYSQKQVFFLVANEKKKVEPLEDIFYDLYIYFSYTFLKIIYNIYFIYIDKAIDN